MSEQDHLRSQIFFYILFALIAGLVLWLVRSYLDIIVFSLMMVIILKPVHDAFLYWLRGRTGLATLMTLLTFFMVVIIPAWLMLRVTSEQVIAIAASFTDTDAVQPDYIAAFQAQYNELLQAIPFAETFRLGAEQVAELTATIRTLIFSLARILVNLGLSIPGLFARLIVFLSIVAVLLPNYSRFVQRLILLSPLEDEVDRLYLRKIKSMVWAMVVGILIIALVQGLTMGIFFWLAGVPYTPLWTLLAVVAATLPLGASLIAIPVGVVLLILEDYLGGLIVLAGYLLVVANLDTLLRPRLVSKEAYLNAALVLLGALGGYELFGFFGVVYGPVIMVMLLTTLDVYETYYVRRERQEAPPEV
jgi:predicted PurR-regulated permease PerM